MCSAGEYNLRLGITKELNPELVSTHQGKLSNASPSLRIKLMPKDVHNASISCCRTVDAKNSFRVHLMQMALQNPSGLTGDARVLEGHAFIVEAAVSVGGRDMKQGINVHRFANRIPLLFEVPLLLSISLSRLEELQMRDQDA